MGPRLSNGATTGLTNTLSQMNEISALAAIDAVRIFRQIKNYEEVDFEILKGTVVLPYKKMPSLEEVKASIEKMGDPEKLDCLEIPTYSTLKKIEKLYEDNVEFKTEMKIPQALFTFNKVAFVPIPFEVFSPINLRIRLFSPFEYTLCTGITNGSNSYLPNQEEIIRGGYEVDSFICVPTYKLVENTDDIIIQENLKILESKKK
jgi:hypothetical protein